jgi:peptide/nickel transport system substrate-binding protein
MSYRWEPAALLLALVLALGCGDSGQTPRAVPSGDPEGPPVRGDWLVLHLLADPENLNPITSNDSAANSVLSWMFPSLLTLDNQTLAQRPVIARELPEVSEDKLTYTFKLRSDATFADGKPVTAHDVLFTLKVTKNPAVLAPHARNYLVSVKGAEALDDHTLRIDLREPYFRNDLVLGGLQPLPRHHYDPDGLLEEFSVANLDQWSALGAERQSRAEAFAEKFNKDFHRRPMGAGAFEIRDPENDIVTGERIVLKRRDDFWAPDDPVHGDAWVNRVVFRVINDQEASLVSFKSGDLDVIGLTPLQYQRPDTNSSRFNERADKHVRMSTSYTYIGWNQKRPIFRDRQLRRALRYFVDKDAIIEEILFGLGVAVESPIYIERPEYNRALPAHVFDPEKGKALLTEAGWVDSDGDGVLDKDIGGERVALRFEIISNSGNAIRKAIGLTVIDELKRAGIEASFREIDWSIMLSKVKRFDFDAVILGWGMSVVAPDAYQLWHSTQAVEGGSNHVAFTNEEVDRILEVYRTEFDEAKRIEMYNRFQEILHEEQPYTFLFAQKAITAWDRRFAGVVWYPSGSSDLREWWVPLDHQKYTQ